MWAGSHGLYELNVTMLFFFGFHFILRSFQTFESFLLALAVSVRYLRYISHYIISQSRLSSKIRTYVCVFVVSNLSCDR